MTPLFGTRAIKRDLLPAAGTKAKVGMGYNQCLEEFARESWAPERASEIAASLAGTRRRLRELSVRERNRGQE